MSAFVVENATIHKIIAYLRRHPGVMPNGQNMVLKQDRYELGLREAGQPRRDAWAELGAELRLLNVAAVEARYPDCKGKDLPGRMDENSYEHRTVPIPSAIEAHKAVSCLSYQCCEGNIDETELYKTLEEIKNNLAREIVYALPEHAAAEWG